MERSSNWDRSKLEKIRPDLHINIVLVQVIIGVVCCQQHEDVTIQLQVRTLYIELAWCPHQALQDYYYLNWACGVWLTENVGSSKKVEKSSNRRNPRIKSWARCPNIARKVIPFSRFHIESIQAVRIWPWRTKNISTRNWLEGYVICKASFWIPVFSQDVEHRW